MTLSEFQIQMQRLQKRWPGIYDDDRCQIFWDLSRDFTPEWFKKTCDDFIGRRLMPPLLDEFETAVSFERERVYEKEKKKRSEDAYAFLTSHEYNSPEIIIKLRELIDHLKMPKEVLENR